MKSQFNFLGRMFAAAALLTGAMASQALAAGVSKVKLFTVPDTALGGYTASPPAGWALSYQFLAATPAGSATEEIMAINVPVATTPGISIYYGSPLTNPSPPIVLTRLSATGTVLSTDAIPIQIDPSMCTFQNGTGSTAKFNGCPPAPQLVVTPMDTNKGRFLVYISKRQRMASTNTVDRIEYIYVYDPSGTIPADKWTLLSAFNLNQNAGNAGPANSPFSAIFPPYFDSMRDTADINWFSCDYATDMNACGTIKNFKLKLQTSLFKAPPVNTYLIDKTVAGSTTVWAIRNK